MQSVTEFLRTLNLEMPLSLKVSRANQLCQPGYSWFRLNLIVLVETPWTWLSHLWLFGSWDGYVIEVLSRSKGGFLTSHGIVGASHVTVVRQCENAWMRSVNTSICWAWIRRTFWTDLRWTPDQTVPFYG